MNPIRRNYHVTSSILHNDLNETEHGTQQNDAYRVPNGSPAVPKVPKVQLNLPPTVLTNSCALLFPPEATILPQSLCLYRAAFRCKDKKQTHNRIVCPGRCPMFCPIRKTIQKLHACRKLEPILVMNNPTTGSDDDDDDDGGGGGYDQPAVSFVQQKSNTLFSPVFPSCTLPTKKEENGTGWYVCRLKTTHNYAPSARKRTAQR